MTAHEIIQRLDAIREKRAPIGYDLEGATFVSCQAFAESPTRAFCVVTDNLGADSVAVWAAITAVLEDPLVPKWTWNAHHELAVLKLAHGITLRGWEDGMALWFERFPELPKGLKYVASILSRRPCWTEGISFDDDDESAGTAMRGESFYVYNMNDAAATIELSMHPQIQPAPVARKRYELRKVLIEALTWASLKGINYDREAARTLRAQLTPRLWLAQARVNDHAGTQIPTGDALFRAAVERWCHKVKLRRYALPAVSTGAPGSEAVDETAILPPANAVTVRASTDPGFHFADEPPPAPRKRKSKSKEKPAPLPLTWQAAAEIAVKDGADALASIQAAAAQADRSTGDDAAIARAQLAELLGRGINVKSTPQVLALLDECGLPKVFRRGERDDESARTKDADVLLDLYLRTGHEVTVALLTCIALRTQLQELDRQLDSDGRIRCSFISCGTTTDRTTSKKWLTGSGGNLQTVPRAPINFRVCYRPDDGPAPGDGA